MRLANEYLNVADWLCAFGWLEPHSLRTLLDGHVFHELDFFLGLLNLLALRSSDQCNLDRNMSYWPCNRHAENDGNRRGKAEKRSSKQNTNYWEIHDEAVQMVSK